MMGLSSSKQKTSSSQNTTETGTTTPQNPQWVVDSIADWTGRIGSMMDADPNGFVAPASPLQQKAWNGTGQLDAWKTGMATASQLAAAAANRGANLAGTPAQMTAAQRGVSTYAAPRLGGPTLTAANGYRPTDMAAAKVDPAAMAHMGYQAIAANASDRMGAYRNPYEQEVVGTTLADFDADAGRLRAQQAAQAARTGAFGGSRNAILAAQTEGELARARASTAAGLRAAGFNAAAGLGAADADRATAASQFNTGQMFDTARYNAGSVNAQRALQAQLNQGANQFNAQGQTDASRYLADARNASGAANAGSQNQFALAQAGMDSDAARYGADARNLQQSENMAALNAAAGANMGAGNQFALFNAGQQDQAAARALQGAGMLGDLSNQYGAGVRSDLQLLSGLGDQQRQIEQAYRMAPLAQLEMGGKLLGGTPFSLFQGQQVDTTGTSNGTSVTRSSPSLFNQLLAAGQLGTSLFGGGGG
jgi:hypothetical protein